MRWVPQVSLATQLRVSLALLVLPLTAFLGSAVTALPWVLLVLTLDLAATALLAAADEPSGVRHVQALAIIGTGAVVAGLASEYAGPGAAALLLVPSFHAGLRYGRRGALAIPVLGAVTGVVAHWATGHWLEPQPGRLAYWTLGSVILGLLGAWSSHMQVPEETPDPSLAAEASMLLRRLHELADSLDTGFDAPASAEMALQDLAAGMRSSRSAVLVGYGSEPAVPLAIRGADRVPWPDPTTPGSILWHAWQQGAATLVRWDGDPVESSVIAVPLVDGTGQRLGLLVADRPASTPFSEADLDSAQQVALAHAATIDLSVVFASLRERAGLEERERLAREMHDGIAQEMVALGFGLDSLRRQARSQHSPLADNLDAMRADLSRLLADLRFHIADLRIAVRPETGLGALIGTRLQSFGATTGVSTRIHLSENGFRLPAHTEVLIYRLFLQAIADARQAMDATILEVELNVAAPRVELRVSHDGTSALRARDFENHPLRALGGDVTVEPAGERGVTLRMRMRTRGASPSATLSHERIPQPS